jgi:acylphosphatase
MADWTVCLVVHGIVQGVGYRHLVRTVAIRHGIKGFVKNEEDGSVRIVAIGPDSQIEQFIDEIDVDFPAGPSVINIERVDGDSERFPELKSGKGYSEFLVVH